MTKARIAASIISASVLTLAGIALPAPSIASHDSSVIVGPYPGLRCDSASQAINDPEDCQRLGSLKGLVPLTHAPIITHSVPLLYGFGVSAD
jgi:hypothetical protein